MATIPANPEDVTTEWINEVTDWNVNGVELTEIGVGLGMMSAVYRATLDGGNGPDTAVIKLTARDEANAQTSAALNMYGREVAFFSGLGQRSPIRVPEGYHAEVADNGLDVVVMMEDMGGNRPVDQITGMSIDDAKRTVTHLANWHAEWWGDIDGLAESGAALPLGNEVYPALLPALFEEGWAKLTASGNCTPPESLAEIAARFGEYCGPVLSVLDSHNKTLLHGDFRADNIMFDDDGKPVLIDFQLTHTGSAAFDLAYFMTQSLDAGDCSAHEQELFGIWKAALIEAGVPETEMADLWDDYRRAALFCLVYPVVASRGMDLEEPRTAQLANVMVNRMARAATELNLADLI